MYHEPEKVFEHLPNWYELSEEIGKSYTTSALDGLQYADEDVLKRITNVIESKRGMMQTFTGHYGPSRVRVGKVVWLLLAEGIESNEFPNCKCCNVGTLASVAQYETSLHGFEGRICQLHNNYL